MLKRVTERIQKKKDERNSTISFEISEEPLVYIGEGLDSRFLQLLMK